MEEAFRFLPECASIRKRPVWNQFGACCPADCRIRCPPRELNVWLLSFFFAILPWVTACVKRKSHPTHPMQDEPEEEVGFQHKMSLEGNGMLRIDHQHVHRTTVTPLVVFGDKRVSPGYADSPMSKHSERNYTSKQMGDACEMLIASEMTLAGIPAARMPDNWPHYDVIAQPKGGGPPQRVSVKSRTFRRGASFVAYDKHSQFDWLAIVLLPGDGQTQRRTFIIPRHIADARSRKDGPKAKDSRLLLAAG